MKKTFTCKPSAQARRAVKAAVSTSDMLDAFEDRLAEMNIGFKTDVSCATDKEDVLQVEIKPGDKKIKYIDVEGGFGEKDAVYTLEEIKDFWNREHTNDPVLVDYESYDEWWKDTLENFMKEVEE